MKNIQKKKENVISHFKIQKTVVKHCKIKIFQDIGI